MYKKYIALMFLSCSLAHAMEQHKRDRDTDNTPRTPVKRTKQSTSYDLLDLLRLDRSSFFAIFPVEMIQELKEFRDKANESGKIKNLRTSISSFKEKVSTFENSVDSHIQQGYTSNTLQTLLEQAEQLKLDSDEITAETSTTSKPTKLHHALGGPSSSLEKIIDSLSFRIDLEAWKQSINELVFKVNKATTEHILHDEDVLKDLNTDLNNLFDMYMNMRNYILTESSLSLAEQNDLFNNHIIPFHDTLDEIAMAIQHNIPQ